MKYLTIDEIAESLRISRGTVANLIHAGVIISTQIGRQQRINEEDLQDYISRQSSSLGYTAEGTNNTESK